MLGRGMAASGHDVGHPLARPQSLACQPLRRRGSCGNFIARGGVDRSTERRTLSLNTVPEDAEILARVRGGDRDAYAELVTRHAPMAVRTAVLLGAGGEAEDVVQEAFVKAYAALDGFKPGAPFRPWLLRIVANETRNLHRAAGRRLARERRAWEQAQPLLAARPDDPVDALQSAERQNALVLGLARLSPAHRQVVTCRYLLELDEAETAAVLGWPRGTVKSRLSRALIKLREALDTDVSPDLRREVKEGG
jgi:RNA polymerase sigma-70 factor (ECF subfamily)